MFDMIPFDRRSNNLFDTFDKMMDDSFWNGSSRQFVPCRTDIIDAGDRFVLKADMPGFSKEEIRISVQGDELTISAERKTAGDVKYVRRERRYDSLSRSFSFDGIDTEKISASYNDGVLQVELPKAVPEKPETVNIEIK